MTVVDYLTEHGCSFRVTDHDRVFTACQLATAEHVSPHKVAKPVVVRASNGQFYLCVLPGDRKISLFTLQQHLGVEHVRLATEHEMASLFRMPSLARRLRWERCTTCRR